MVQIFKIVYVNIVSDEQTNKTNKIALTFDFFSCCLYVVWLFKSLLILHMSCRKLLKHLNSSDIFVFFSQLEES